MAILTSTPGTGNDVSIYDVPDDVLAQYAITAAAPMPSRSKMPKARAKFRPTARSVFVASFFVITTPVGGITTTATAKTFRLSARPDERSRGSFSVRAVRFPERALRQI
jgi:hypothetical protein